MYNNLQEFLRALDAAGEMKTVKRQVSPEIEISRFTDEESKSPRGGKALFFENVEGSEFPVATNIFGSPRRICMALGGPPTRRPGRPGEAIHGVRPAQKPERRH